MNLFKSLILVSITNTLSKTLGFIKDIVVARIFGASDITDSFFISFKLTNLIRRIFSEGTFFQVFMPLLVEYKKTKKINIIKEFISCTIGLIIFLLILIILTITIFSPLILKLSIPGFVNTNFKFNLTNKIFRIMLPYIIISTLSSLVSAILNTWDNFIIPSLSSALINIVMIFFSIFSSYISNPPILALAWSMIVGNIFQLLYQLKYLNDIDMIIIPKIKLNNDGLLILINKMWPVLLSTSISQISILSNTIFTSFLASGSISWMYYADRIIEFPSGILGNTLSTILFPSLSKSVTNKNKDEYSKSLDWGLRLSIMLSLPITLALIILSKPIIFSIFQYGKFSCFDANMTCQSLIAYSVGLIGIILVKVLTPSFYSYQDTITPLKISIWTFLITQILNFLLIPTLKHIGLSLSISLTACFNSILLYLFLIKKKLFKPQPGWNKFLIRIISSTINMSIILIIMLNYMSNWEISNIFSRLIRLLIMITVGIITYLISLILMGFTFKDFYHSIE